MDIIFTTNHYGFYFNVTTEEGTIKLYKEDAENIKKIISMKPENK